MFYNELKMLLVSLLFVAVSLANVESVLVQVEQGTLIGEVLQRSTDNGQYYSFKGIRYAAPPVGDLRFRDPRPPLPWLGFRNALAHGSVCPQIELSTEKYLNGSNEDCLFLNVYTPELNPKTRLPVMFYIHGGFFAMGTSNSNQFGPDFLLDHDVVVVTINYRLGVFGFLSLDIEEAVGNAGLKDQVAALKWVKKNIAKFGGDPDNVTIFGQSAGGASATLHTLSPLSKGLFKRAIALSGVFFKDFDIPFEHKRRAFLLAQQLGLYTKDPKEAIKFLKNVSVKDLVEAKPFLLYSEGPRREVLELFNFRPIVEKNLGGEHFFIEHPQKLLSENKTNVADLIIGHTTEEGIYKADEQKEAILKYFPYYKEFLVPYKIANKVNATEVLKLGDRVQKHYFGNREISEGSFRNVIKLYTYFNYVYNIYRFTEMWVKTGNKAYFYEFTCFSERNVNGLNGIKYGLRNSTHSDDLRYLFDGSKYNLTLDKESRSYKMIVQTCTLYTNFAKYGNPTPSGFNITWVDYSKNNSYLDIGYELILKTAKKQPEIDFWRSIYEYAGLMFS